MDDPKQNPLIGKLSDLASSAKGLLKKDDKKAVTLNDYLVGPDAAYELGINDVSQFVRIGAIFSRILELNQIVKARGESKVSKHYLQKYIEGVSTEIAHSILEGRGIIRNHEHYQEKFTALYKECYLYLQKVLSLL